MLTLGGRRGSLTAVVSKKQKIYGTLKLRAQTICCTAYFDNGIEQEPVLSAPRLPLELLERIIELYFESYAPGALRLMHEHVRNMRLCNRAFNETTLKCVLETVFLPSAVVWTNVAKLMEKLEGKGTRRGGRKVGFGSVRHLIFNRASDLALNAPERLTRFTKLSSLCLNFGTEGLNTQFDCVTKLFDALDASSRSLQSSSLSGDGSDVALGSVKSLKLTNVPAIDVYFLSRIASAFPNLVALEINVTSRLNMSCCPGCFEDSMTLSMHSPVGRRYLSGEDLALKFGEALQPLSSTLKHLTLDIFLLPEVLLDQHVLHNDSGALDLHPATLSSCLKCRDSELLRNKYTSVRELQKKEMVASLRMAQYIKALETIAWASYGQEDLEATSTAPSALRADTTGKEGADVSVASASALDVNPSRANDETSVEYPDLAEMPTSTVVIDGVDLDAEVSELEETIAAVDDLLVNAQSATQNSSSVPSDDSAEDSDSPDPVRTQRTAVPVRRARPNFRLEMQVTRDVKAKRVRVQRAILPTTKSGPASA